MAGLEEYGGRIEYRANAREIVTSGSGGDLKAIGVRLADGRIYRCCRFLNRQHP